MRFNPGELIIITGKSSIDSNSIDKGLQVIGDQIIGYYSVSKRKDYP
jgi:hypothetical protein